MMKLFAISSVLLLSSSPHVAVYAQPSNDECIDATLIPPTINPFPYVDTIPNFSDATENPNDVLTNCTSFFISIPTNGTFPPGNQTFVPTTIPDLIDVWYTWVPASDGAFDFSTIGSAELGSDCEYPIYPSFAIFEGNDCDALQEVTCGYSYESGIQLTGGTKYFIKIIDAQYDDFATKKLVFTITETSPPPPNDECIDATVIPPSPEFPYSTEPIFLNSATESVTDPILDCTIDNSNNTSLPPIPISDFPTSAPFVATPIESETVWYTWTPSISDEYDFSTVGSKDVYGNDIYASIGMFVGATCDSLEEIDCSAYSSSLKRVSLNAGVQYYIMIQTYSYNSGANLTLTVKPTPPPPPNDECINAIVVDPFVGGDDVYTGDTSSASVDIIPGSDECGPSIAAPGTWYKFTNTLQSAVPILATTCNNGTDFDTQISVFKGDSCGNLECVGGNDDGFGGIELECGLSSRFQFLASGLTTYYVLVHGFGESSGNYALTIEGITTYFGLIDSKTDTFIEVIDTYIDYGSIASTTSSLNIEAVFSNQTSIRSVMVTFDDPPVSFCEKKAPFSVFTDSNGNFRDALIPVGTHEVTATAFGQQACKGPAGTSMSKTFDVIGCYYYTLLHDGSDVFEIYGNDFLPTGCDINIELIPFCGFEVKGVTFALRNTDTNTIVHTRSEKLAPFFLFGNIGNNTLDGIIAPGAYSLDITIDGIKHSPIEFSVNSTDICN